MRLLSCCLLLSTIAAAEPRPESATSTDVINRFFTTTLAHGEAYEQLRVLTSENPGRLAGTAALERAIDWSERRLASQGLDRVCRQDVKVPHWVRGEHDEIALLAVDGSTATLAGLALGNSGATPPAGVTAEVVEVHSLDELTALGADQVRGRVVFFNRPMDPQLFSPSALYRGAVDQRFKGPATAAGLGAVAALVRSLTPITDDVPHSGVTHFPSDVPPIPAAALSTIAADRLAAALAADSRTRLRLNLQPRSLSDATSHNVIGEIRGSAFPDEIIVVGAHLDSWDNTPGAHDDGAGVVQSIEVLRLFRELGITPRHTLRCVLFTNEENGLRGALAYAESARSSAERHLFAIESDSGGFAPVGFSFAGAEGDQPHLRAARWRPLFEPWGIWNFRAGRGGTDVNPLRPLGAVVADLAPDSQRYFDLHHAATDRFETVNARELHLGAAALAALVWLVDVEGL